MPNRLVGSLVVAQAELPPTETPKVAALSAHLRGIGVAAAYFRSKLGSYVRPLGGTGFRAESMSRVGNVLVLEGRDATGQVRRVQASRDVLDTFEPSWVTKVAAIIRIAWAPVFDPMIKSLIRDHGLPVDENVNWDLRLHSIFSRKGISPKDEDLRAQGIQDAIVTILVQRDALAAFDPGRLDTEEPDPTFRSLPLSEKVSVYLTQLFKWQTTERGGAGQKIRQWTEGETGMSPELESILPSTPGGHSHDVSDVPEDIFSADNERGLMLFRQNFLSYLQRFQSTATAQQAIILFNLIMASDDGVEIKAKWEDATGTSYSRLRKVLIILGEELLHFSRTIKAPPIPLLSLIKAIRGRTRDVADDIEDSSEPHDTPEIPEASDETLEGDEVGPKANAARSASVTITAAQRFASALTQAVLDLRKTAKPHVLDQSMVYLKLQGDPADPRYLRLTFFGPRIKALRQSVYRIEVGDASTDPGLNQGQIRRQLSDLVLPVMKYDVDTSDHAVLDKVILRLRKWAWEQAVTYFEVPVTEKPHWSNVLKLDIVHYEDTKVSLVDRTGERLDQSYIAASLTAPHLIVAGVSHVKRAISRAELEDWRSKKAAGSLGNTENMTPAQNQDQTPDPDHQTCATIASGAVFNRELKAALGQDEDLDSRWDKVQPRPTWNEAEGKWEPGDATEGGLLGGQPARYAAENCSGTCDCGHTCEAKPGVDVPGCHHPKQAKAPGHAYKDGDGKWVCRACAKGQREKFGRPYNPDDSEIQGKTCSRCYKTLGDPEQKLKSAGMWGADDERFHARENMVQTNQVRQGLSRYLGQLLNSLYVQPGGQNMTLRQFLGSNPITALFQSTDKSVRLMGNKLRSDLQGFLHQNFTPQQIAQFQNDYGSNVTDWLVDRKIQGSHRASSAEGVARELGAKVYNEDYHDGEAEPSTTHMAQHLEANGLVPSAENMQAAIEGFKTVRDGHTVVGMLLATRDKK